MTKIFVNHFGWVMDGTPKTGLKFTKHKAGAKPFDDFGKELFNVRFYIERTIKANYDLITEAR